jgi:hypothetical protein
MRQASEVRNTDREMNIFSLAVVAGSEVIRVMPGTRGKRLWRQWRRFIKTLDGRDVLGTLVQSQVNPIHING